MLGNTTSVELVAIIGKMVKENKISFQREELPAEGVDHNRAVHITVKYGDKVIYRILVDGGSEVNIFPLSTL